MHMPGYSVYTRAVLYSVRIADIIACFHTKLRSIFRNREGRDINQYIGRTYRVFNNTTIMYYC